MAHVSVSINGRQYRMACDDGQEHHLARLAHDLDQRIANLRGTFGEIGDMRLTIMAALILIDELSEQRQRMHRIETELTGLQHARAAAVDRSEAMELTSRQPSVLRPSASKRRCACWSRGMTRRSPSA